MKNFAYRFCRTIAVLIMACKLGYIQVHANIVSSTRHAETAQTFGFAGRIKGNSETKLRRTVSTVRGRTYVLSVRDRLTIFFEAHESKFFNHFLHIHHQRQTLVMNVERMVEKFRAIARDTMRTNRTLMKNPAVSRKRNIYKMPGKKIRFFNRGFVTFHFTYLSNLSL